MKKLLRNCLALFTAAVTVFWAGCSEQAMTEINMTEEELKALNNLVSGYFDFAELAARRHRVMRMEDYLKQLDSLLTSIGEQVLEHNGHVSHEQAMQKAEQEYRIYQQIELSPVERDYLLSITELKQVTEKSRHKKG